MSKKDKQKEVKDVDGIDYKSEFERMVNEFEELELRYKRVLADYHNLQRRSDEEKEKTIIFANEVLISKLVEVADDFEESLKHIKDDGLEKLVTKFQGILLNEGLEIVNPEGEEFDPSTQEAIEKVNGENNLVIKVYRVGYKLHNKVLRPAIVAVGNGEKKGN